MSNTDYTSIRASSEAFLTYLVARYSPNRLEEPLPYDSRPNLSLAFCQGDDGAWEVCLPLDLGDHEVKESVRLADEGVKTRGDLIAYMKSPDWDETMRLVADVDEDGNPLPDLPEDF